MAMCAGARLNKVESSTHATLRKNAVFMQKNAAQKARLAASEWETSLV
jgi:hypothetical protein